MVILPPTVSVLHTFAHACCLSLDATILGNIVNGKKRRRRYLNWCLFSASVTTSLNTFQSKYCHQNSECFLPFLRGIGRRRLEIVREHSLQLLYLCLINNRFTCLAKSKPVKQEVSHTVIVPLKRNWVNIQRSNYWSPTHFETLQVIKVQYYNAK